MAPTACSEPWPLCDSAGRRPRFMVTKPGGLYLSAQVLSGCLTGERGSQTDGHTNPLTHGLGFPKPAQQEVTCVELSMSSWPGVRPGAGLPGACPALQPGGLCLGGWACLGCPHTQTEHPSAGGAQYLKVLRVPFACEVPAATCWRVTCGDFSASFCLVCEMGCSLPAPGMLAPNAASVLGHTSHVLTCSCAHVLGARTVSGALDCTSGVTVFAGSSPTSEQDPECWAAGGCDMGRRGGGGRYSRPGRRQR